MEPRREFKLVSIHDRDKSRRIIAFVIRPMTRMQFARGLALVLSIIMIFTMNGCAKNRKTDDTLSPTSAALNKSNAKKEQNTNKLADAKGAVAAKFPTEVVNNNKGMDGGVLKVALVASSAFAGVLNPCFYEDSYDNQILSWFTEPIISYDDNFVADQDGAATYEYDKTAKTVTLHMRKGVNWQDGVPVTLDDLVFAYEVICHKDYKGIRFSENEMNVIGVDEYHSGKLDKISGLELSDDKMTLTIHFKDFYPSILVGGFWSSPIPRHYYEGIAIKDMAAHEKTRKSPIGYGPFKIKNIVPGESVELVRNDDYWMGKPKLDGVIVTVMKPELVPAAMKDGKFDIAGFSSQQYPNYMNPTNYQYIGEVETVFSYTGFKLGKWDAAKNENIFNPNAKMANVKLRQAIGYSMDNDSLAKNLFNGLRFLATSVITPRHKSYYNKDMEGYVYNPQIAKDLLEEAGYKDIDKDGYREDPDGKKFTITWAVMDGENMDTYAQYKIQCWKEVGLKVELYNGRLTEYNAFYDAVEGDDAAMDMYDGAWQTGYDPNPASLWGHYSSANYTRYTSETFDAIVKDISSDTAWDNAIIRKKYKEWQEAFFHEVPAIPTLWRVQLYAINNRVKNFSVTSSDITQAQHLIELTAKDSIR